MSRNKLTLIAFAALAIAITGAPVAVAQTLQAGSDVWKTEGTGSFVSFVGNPIPAGFFCPGSPVFAGTIEVTGKPLATTPSNALRGADTVIVRPQSAAFDANGVAQTTGFVAAMSLKGHVVLQFNVHKDGSISDLAIVQPSAIDAFNNAAVNAIRGSNPTQPLPPEYPTDKVLFTVTFYYNESPGQ